MSYFFSHVFLHIIGPCCSFVVLYRCVLPNWRNKDFSNQSIINNRLIFCRSRVGSSSYAPFRRPKTRSPTRCSARRSGARRNLLIETVRPASLLGSGLSRRPGPWSSRLRIKLTDLNLLRHRLDLVIRISGSRLAREVRYIPVYCYYYWQWCGLRPSVLVAV